eukprot:988919-Pelagomonas_calceolata.AAC.1
MNVPILRRDLGRIKVVRLTWDRVHKDSINLMVTLVTGRGAITKGTPSLELFGRYFQELLFPAP